MLVGAVLRPEQREDGELEVVRIALEQLPDPVQLPVRQPEGAVERLFRDARQVVESSRGVGENVGGGKPSRETGRASGTLQPP
jgi:hypothetical protein